MPSLTNHSMTQAISQLENLGLDLDIDYNSLRSYHDTIPENYVISTDPSEGEVLSEGQQVFLEISLGPEEQTVPMGNLIGMTREEAEQAILALGLEIGSVRELASDEQPVDRVWYQSVAPYT